MSESSMVDRERFIKQGWRSWMNSPPGYHEYEVVEILRRGDGDWMNGEPGVHRLADLQHPRNDAWNVCGVWWRPVL